VVLGVALPACVRDNGASGLSNNAASGLGNNAASGLSSNAASGHMPA
jgi:hypothetical protein